MLKKNGQDIHPFKKKRWSHSVIFYLMKDTTRGAFLLPFRSFINSQKTHLYQQFNIILQDVMRRWAILILPLAIMLK